MEPDLSNEREKREWLYLCLLAGEDRARAAISKIPDDLSPYPAEIAQVLGVSLPSDPTRRGSSTWLEKGKKEIAKIKQALKESR